MGIDIYLKWKGQTEEERKAQYTGFSITSGHVGYLREAYNREPYATKVMFPETWQDHNDTDDEKRKGVSYPASVLRERLSRTLAAVRERYGDSEVLPEAIQSWEAFVALAERKEAETGAPCRVVNSY